MRILCITLEQSKSRPDILDWLTLSETKGGKNTERCWIIDTNTNLINPHRDFYVESTIALLYLCKNSNYPLLMIMKNV